jgi:hypothetical protein
MSDISEMSFGQRDHQLLSEAEAQQAQMQEADHAGSNI